MASRTAHPWRLLGVAVLVVAVLTGCVKLDGVVTISQQDTFSGEATVAVGRAWSEGNGEDPYALQRILEEEIGATADEGISTEPYEDSEYIGATLTFTDVPIERIEDATTGALVITAEEGGHVVAGRFDDLDVTAGEGGDEVPTPWVIDLSVTFPDAVTDHDGTLVGRTVSWDLEPGQDELFATSAGSGFSLPIPLPVLLFGLLLVGTGVWLLVSRRRRRAAGEQR